MEPQHSAYQKMVDFMRAHVPLERRMEFFKLLDEFGAEQARYLVKSQKETKGGIVTAKEMIDQIEFNALNDCDKWRYYRDASDKLAAHLDLERKYVAACEAIEAACKRIGHGEYCNCSISSGSHPDKYCDCGKLTFEKALDKFQKETERQKYDAEGK